MSCLLTWLAYIFYSEHCKLFSSPVQQCLCTNCSQLGRSKRSSFVSSDFVKGTKMVHDFDIAGHL